MAKLAYLPNVVTLEYDENLCNGCTICVIVCPHEVFEMVSHKAKIINRDACIECGACMINCEPGALTVQTGVGCAAGIINGMIRGTEPNCDCADDKIDCC